jgi:hypothetical protein
VSCEFTTNTAGDTRYPRSKQFSSVKVVTGEKETGCPSLGVGFYMNQYSSTAAHAWVPDAKYKLKVK